MKSFIKEIFEYHHHFNQLLIDQLVQYQSILPERSIPLFNHMLNAHRIWNARIVGHPTIGVNDMHPLLEYKIIDADNYSRTLKIIDGFDLSQIITYKTSSGEEYFNSIRDILFQVANHTTHHRGQIISDFRQSGIPPLVTDYIFYKREA